MHPLISFIIPYYENHALLGEAIGSIRQYCHNTLHEIIVVDDASPTHEHLEALKEECTIIRRGENAGPSACRNEGIRQAQGTYLSFLDSDDLLIANPTDMLEGSNGEDMVMGRYVDEAHYPLLGREFPRTSTLRQDPVLIKRIGFWSHLYRRDFLLGNSISFPEDMRVAEDLVFLARTLGAAKSIWLTKQVNLTYRGDREGCLSAQGLSDYYIQCVFELLPERVMDALEGIDDAYAIRFCMLFSRRIEDLKIILKTHPPETFDWAATQLGAFARHYKNLTNFTDTVKRLNIRWNDRKTSLAEALSESETTLAPAKIRAFIANPT